RIPARRSASPTATATSGSEDFRVSFREAFPSVAAGAEAPPLGHASRVQSRGADPGNVPARGGPARAGSPGRDAYGPRCGPPPVRPSPETGAPSAPPRGGGRGSARAPEDSSRRGGGGRAARVS